MANLRNKLEQIYFVFKIVSLAWYNDITWRGLYTINNYWYLDTEMTLNTREAYSIRLLGLSAVL